jgi:DNA-binding transcriptional ArsR family regulator
MTEVEASRLARRSDIMKAMAHSSRLLLLEELGRGERCVRDLQILVGADMSTVSKHLARLRNVGLIASTKRGLQVFYRLRCPCALSFFDCIEAVITTVDKGEPPRQEASP